MQEQKSTTFLLYLTLILFVDAPFCHASSTNKYQNFTLNIENDNLNINNQDKDYTFAIDANYTFSHNPGTQLTLSRINQKLHRLFFDQAARTKASSVSAGIFGFTAKIKSIPNTYYQERPYASIVYLSFANFLLNTHNDQGFKYSATLGLLGLNTFKHLQNAYHKQVGFNSLNGWEKQLSQGGEATGKLSFEWQHPLNREGVFMLLHAVKGSIGYITELQHTLYLRLGNLSSPWWYQQPSMQEYGEKHFNFTRKHNETFLSLGFFNKVRLYNAFLQGQFSEREQALGFSEIEPHLFGFWLGIEHHFFSGLGITYQATYQSSEIKQGRANRAMHWGGISISQRF